MEDEARGYDLDFVLGEHWDVSSRVELQVAMHVEVCLSERINQLEVMLDVRMFADSKNGSCIRIEVVSVDGEGALMSDIWRTNRLRSSTGSSHFTLSFLLLELVKLL